MVDESIALQDSFQVIAVLSPHTEILQSRAEVGECKADSGVIGCRGSEVGRCVSEMYLRQFR